MMNNGVLKITDKATTKAMKDSTFRAALVKDANEAIKNEFNEELPLKVTFHEFSDDKLVFVLPNKPKEGELGDDVLSDVLGGVSARDNCRVNTRSDWLSQTSGGLSFK